ncbi:MAG: transglutaminase family protein [Pseudomonadales bacterium]|nr:transglutaminase family protein [Pseudomonadales bacterium]
MRRLKLFHETVYTFQNEVELGPHKLMLRPRDGHDVRIENSALQISPNATVKWYRDALDNSVAIATFTERTKHLSIVSEVTIEHYEDEPLDFLVADYAVNYPFSYEQDEAVALAPYLYRQGVENDPELSNFIGRFWQQGQHVETYVLLDQMSRAIGDENEYLIREEPGVQTPAETLSKGSGSCRDFAFLFMSAARELGLATRFVSGYLHAPSTESEFGETHAWAEVYLPGAGWKGFDPTSRVVTGNHHIPAAVAIRPDAVPPVSGHFTGPEGETPRLEVRVQVQPFE